MGSVPITVHQPAASRARVRSTSRSSACSMPTLSRTMPGVIPAAACTSGGIDACVIVDPPRAGLHEDVIAKLLEAAPARIIYLSCNPVTQARDIKLLLDKYDISHLQGYNFFPRTPHIENLVILDLR